MDILERIKKQEYQKGYERGFGNGRTDGINFAVKMMSEVIAYVLADKYRFGHQKLNQVIKSLEYASDSILNGYMTLDDIEAVLKDEHDIIVQSRDK